MVVVSFGFILLPHTEFGTKWIINGKYVKDFILRVVYI